MKEVLEVCLNRTPLGRLFFDGGEDSYELEYSTPWRETEGFTVSPHLKAGECSSGAVKRFISNLLPEGRWLDELSTANQVSKSNVFGLIGLIGADTAGALTFHREGPGISLPPTSFRRLERDELTERIAARQEISIARWDGRMRLSVAGVQDKLPVVITPDGEMGFGEGDLASTHLLKFGRRPEMHLVINEYLCMKLAELIQLPAAKVALERFGEPVLAVERFDRFWQDGTVERRHIIDGCQLLDLPPTYKYERPFGKTGHAAEIRTGANLPGLFAACSLCSIPALALRNLLNWVLFQLLIGNCDAHGKNISFMIGHTGIDVAPGYDMLSTDIYGDEFDLDLAMAIGEEFRSDEIMPFQLAEFCESCRLPKRQVADTLRKLCEAVLSQLGALPLNSFKDDDERSFADALVKHIRASAQRFLTIAKELPSVAV